MVETNPPVQTRTIEEELAEQGVYYGNPGSVSIPKAGSTHGYMVLENCVLTHKSLCDGEVLSPLHISVNP